MQAAVLGYGRWGRVVAGKLAAMPEADLVAVVDPDMGARAIAHDQLGVPVYDTLESMYDEHEPAMACVTTPPQLHALHALECMSRGSHVWVTKPMAMTAGDCEAIIAGAHAAERMVAVDHTLLWEPAIVTACQMVERGELGQLLEITTERRQPGPARPEGAIYDLMPHDIAVALRLALGESDEVPSATLWADQRTAYDRVIQARAMIDLEDGPVISCQAHTLWPERRREMWIIGDEGALHVSDRGLRVHDTLRTGEPGVRIQGIPMPVEIRRWDALEAQLADVIRWFDGGSWDAEHRATGFHAIGVVTMLEEASNAADQQEAAEAAA
jgi:predicted dehydrogenase